MTTAVVYDREHVAVRRALLAASTPATPCWRCGFPLGPDPAESTSATATTAPAGPGWSTSDAAPPPEPGKATSGAAYDARGPSPWSTKSP
jgi:hypothetical protein